MKSLLYSFFPLLVTNISCNIYDELETDNNGFRKFEENTHKSSQEELDSSKAHLLKNIYFNFGGYNFVGQVDDIGAVTILNYPDEWQGEITLIRFDDQNIQSPFSPDHCQSIRDKASNGGFEVGIRGSYRSRVSFEVAPFLSYDFKKAIFEAIQATGNPINAIFLRNPVNDLSGIAKLSITDGAISRLTGPLQTLEKQLSLSLNGLLIGPFEKHLIITSGDILCDFANKNATLEMTYTIDGDDKLIKVIYKNMARK
jgi:hypothetical protein